jgi:LAO/AO transport system kinase
MWSYYLEQIQQGNIKAIARSISLVENAVPGFEKLLLVLPQTNVPLIGITGPPGAGKSTLTDALVGLLVGAGKKVAVVCVDPSSPFNLGALLGDRIRMSDWYTHPQVFIRSLATRGSLGGLHPRILEITDLLKAATFDYVIVETVGVGQSEIEIAGLADATLVVLVPEAGDEVQAMKAGLMEIADVFAVNKSDRPDADSFVRNLRLMLAPAFHRKQIALPVVKTIAAQKQGIEELWQALVSSLQITKNSDRHFWLLAEKAWHLIQQRRMQDVDKAQLKALLTDAGKNVNIYQFIKNYS